MNQTLIVMRRSEESTRIAAIYRLCEIRYEKINIVYNGV